ncbi:MAG: EamA family transporter [Candidatus Hodarchaeales archaeon]|jgi:drug/metabolite transporter (DMT)-like permease
MVNPILSLVFGTSAAASWALGDFSGGLSSKKFNAYSVVIFSQFFGLIFLLALILLFSEPIISITDISLSLLSGLFLSIGLTSLYKGIAEEQVGVVVPISAMVAASLPALAGFIYQGLPQINEIFGIILAMISIWVVSVSGSEGKIDFSTLKTPVIAGISFSIYKIVIAVVSASTILWTLFFVRVSSFFILIVFSYSTKRLQRPVAKFLPFFSFIGILDACGGILFLLAVQFGRLDIAAVFSSTHPAFTVLLAYFLMKEKVYRLQWVGIGGIFISMILISL